MIPEIEGLYEVNLHPYNDNFNVRSFWQLYGHDNFVPLEYFDCPSIYFIQDEDGNLIFHFGFIWHKMPQNKSINFFLCKGLSKEEIPNIENILWSLSNDVLFGNDERKYLMLGQLMEERIDSPWLNTTRLRANSTDQAIEVCSGMDDDARKAIEMLLFCSENAEKIIMSIEPDKE